MNKEFYNIAIVSPHLDDGIFSLGAYSEWAIKKGHKVTVFTPFGATPKDEVGKKKYDLLHQEHMDACDILGVDYMNGPFLDDVYPGLDHDRLRDWFEVVLLREQKFDLILVPLGIRHPDHKAVREACDKLTSGAYYSDLPYATDYPEEAAELSKNMTITSRIESDEGELKEKAVRAYASQTLGDVVDRVMQKEIIWTKST